MGADRRTSGLRCLIRKAFPGANPLRRRTDLFEPIALLFVVLVVALTAVQACVVAQQELDRRLAVVQHEQATKHQVVASVVDELPGKTARQRPVVVKWGEPPEERSAVVQLPSAVPATGPLQVWVDDRQRVTTPPLTRAEATQAAGVAGASVVLGSALVTTLLLLGARAWVQHRRLLAWEVEWARVEPQWRDHAS
ncbi:Rv1733c family protein [Saccharopolyspora hordei]|uniref:Transmembrane protein n=1 Tax=Saccharopolyspora hordei TaxID=1838 RepID=A0A853AH41_9PSEU|nr:hypothetical protein [Saccharopolyspora hordei]NYI83116.1 hypothetical protein [Saccharopolyspora hordei]